MIKRVIHFTHNYYSQYCIALLCFYVMTVHKIAQNTKMVGKKIYYFAKKSLCKWCSYCEKQTKHFVSIMFSSFFDMFFILAI